MKRLASIFIISFLLNIVWENFHSFLYDNYMGGKITESVLLHATFADAMIITIISLPFIYIKFFKKRDWLIVVVGVVVAIAIEAWALQTGRWAYNSFMPLIPILSVGLTPIIQLGLLGYVSYRLTDHRT